MARGAKILLPDDPANPEKCTMVQGVVWNPPSVRTNPLRLTKSDRKVYLLRWVHSLLGWSGVCSPTVQG